MDTATLAGVAAYYAALERRLFEVLGGWVPAVEEPEAKLLLRVDSFRHAWHASLWDDVAPRVTVAVEPVGGRAVEAALDELAAAPGADAERLGAVYRVVLPGLVEEYRALAGEGPVGRAVGLMIADDEQSVRRAQSVLAAIDFDGASQSERVE